MATWLFANAGLLASYGTYAGPKGVDNTPAASIKITGPPSKAVIACSYLFVASFAPTWGPVSWIYPPELYPLRVRGKAVALSTSANWAFNFALGYFVPPAFVNIQWRTYLLFGVFCVAMFIHVFFMFPGEFLPFLTLFLQNVMVDCMQKLQTRRSKRLKTSSPIPTAFQASAHRLGRRTLTENGLSKSRDTVVSLTRSARSPAPAPRMWRHEIVTRLARRCETWQIITRYGVEPFLKLTYSEIPTPKGLPITAAYLANMPF